MDRGMRIFKALMTIYGAVLLAYALVATLDISGVIDMGSL